MNGAAFDVYGVVNYAYKTVPSSCLLSVYSCLKELRVLDCSLLSRTYKTVGDANHVQFTMKTMLTIFVLVTLVSSSLAASMRHGPENAYDNIYGEI